MDHLARDTDNSQSLSELSSYDLEELFRAEHAKGIEALRRRDIEAFSASIKRERTIAAEITQRQIEQIRRTLLSRGGC